MAHSQIQVIVCLLSTAMPLRKTIQLIKNFDVTEYHKVVYVYRQDRILKSSENNSSYILFVKPKPTITNFENESGYLKLEKSVRKFGLRLR